VTPRIQGEGTPPQGGRKRSTERVGVGGIAQRRRSEERLRDLGGVNASVSSLGQLGQILENDPSDQATPQPLPAPQRTRQRIVQGETGGLTRRPTVSSREEGRAIGLARGASMRRVNVWDGRSSFLEEAWLILYCRPSGDRRPATRVSIPHHFNESTTA
jgi:hypothetical protein